MFKDSSTKSAFNTLISQYPSLADEVADIQEQAKIEATNRAVELIKGKLPNPSGIDLSAIATELMPEW